jgi:hypothetical protein
MTAKWNLPYHTLSSGLRRSSVRGQSISRDRCEKRLLSEFGSAGGKSLVQPAFSTSHVIV